MRVTERLSLMTIRKLIVYILSQCAEMEIQSNIQHRRINGRMTILHLRLESCSKLATLRNLQLKYTTYNLFECSCCKMVNLSLSQTLGCISDSVFFVRLKYFKEKMNSRLSVYRLFGRLSHDRVEPVIIIITCLIEVIKLLIVVFPSLI